MDSIQRIAIEKINAHPDNPRLVFRQDVVDGIAAQIEGKGFFDPAHALLVRPLDGRYQVLQGHHRWLAGKQAGLETLPCWVREMDDDEAYMQLVLGNVQGELRPIEIGVHALQAVELGEGGQLKGGEGKKEGISEYARKIGKTQGYITQIRQAAEVLEFIKPISRLIGFLDKAQHLAAIHKADKELWPALARWVVERKNKKGERVGASVNQTQEMVKQVCKFDIPKLWQHVFLPLVEVGARFIEEGNPPPEQVSSLVNVANVIKDRILASVNRFGTENFPLAVRDFYQWLSDGKGTYAWDKQELDAYYQKVVASVQEAAKPSEPDAKEGEWYRLGKHILYCGDTSKPEFWQNLPQVAFAFADPPYRADVADWDNDKYQWGHDWLTDKAKVVAVTPGIISIPYFYRGETQMPYRWSVAAWLDNGMTRGALGFGNWIYVGVFAKEQKDLPKKKQDFIKCSIEISETEKTDHKGRKPSEFMQKLLELFTNVNDIVIDPFLGSGTTLFEANKLSRVCIGGENDPDFCNEIIKRWQKETGLGAEKIDDIYSI